MPQLATIQPAMPSKCDVCERPMESPIVCAGCHTLHAPSPEHDYFRLLGLERGYDLDARTLREKFLSISREIHPDRFAGKPAEVGALSLEVAARVNRAYEVLSDPLLRAEYLLELSGGKSAAQDKTVPPAFLAATLALQEEIEEARSAGDSAALAELRRRIKSERESALAEAAKLARLLPGDEANRAALRARLNACKYYVRMMDQTA